MAGSRLAIGVYRRTWRAHLLVKASGFSQRVKEAKRKKGSEGGRPVETAAAVEIGKVAFGNFSLMISTAAWKSREERSAFPQLPQARRSVNKTTGRKKNRRRGIQL